MFPEQFNSKMMLKWIMIAMIMTVIACMGVILDVYFRSLAENQKHQEAQFTQNSNELSVGEQQLQSQQEELEDELQQLDQGLGNLTSNVSAEFQDVRYGCPKLTFIFPFDNSVADFVWYRTHFPRLAEATICFWFNTDDYNSYTAIFSYAVTGSNNELLLGLTPGNFEIELKSQIFIFSAGSFDGQILLHICAWFSTYTDRVGLYINATSQGSYYYGSGAITGGGSLLLAQEQDGINAGDLDGSQAYRGTVTNVMAWRRVLTEAEINEIARSCQCPSDYSVQMSMDRVELFGSAGYRIDSQCLTL